MAPKLLTRKRDAVLFWNHSGIAQFLEVRVTAPCERNFRPFFRIVRIGMKTSFPAAVILHHEFRTTPPAVKIEIAPVLIIDSKGAPPVEQPEAGLVPVRVQVSAINVAAQLHTLRHTLRRAQITHSAQRIRRTLPVQSQTRHASEAREKINIERVSLAGFGSQRSDALPESRSPASADTKGPWRQKCKNQKKDYKDENKSAETPQSRQWSKSHSRL